MEEVLDPSSPFQKKMLKNYKGTEKYKENINLYNVVVNNSSYV
jgi:hypothetical protein